MFKANYIHSKAFQAFSSGQKGMLMKLPHSPKFCLFKPNNGVKYPSAFLGFMFPIEWFEIITE